MALLRRQIQNKALLDCFSVAQEQINLRYLVWYCGVTAGALQFVLPEFTQEFYPVPGIPLAR